MPRVVVLDDVVSGMNVFVMAVVRPDGTPLLWGPVYNDDLNGAGQWGGWLQCGLFGPGADLVVARNSWQGDGLREAFLLAPDPTNPNTGNICLHSKELGYRQPWTMGRRVGDLTGINLSIAANSDGRLELFMVGTQMDLWHCWQVSPAGTWSDWSQEGLGTYNQGSIGRMMAATRNLDGRLEVFLVGLDYHLWHIWQTTPGGSWSSWNQIGGESDTGVHITASPGADGRLHAFMVDKTDAVWHASQSNTPGGPFSGWSQLGVLPGRVQPETLCAATDNVGRLCAFAYAHSAIWFYEVTNQYYTDWHQIPGSISTNYFGVGRHHDGRLELFDLEGNHNWQVAPGGLWSGWHPLPMTPPTPIGQPPITVPNIVGLTWDHAFPLLQTYQLNAQVFPSLGWITTPDHIKVVSQSPSAETKVAPGSTVTARVVLYNVYQGLGSLVIQNQNQDGHTVTVWVSDNNAAYKQTYVLPLSATCSVSLSSTHAYVIVVMDPELSNCPSPADPSNVSCQRGIVQVTGATNGPTAVWSVG